jgi:hypothetical protein
MNIIGTLALLIGLAAPGAAFAHGDEPHGDAPHPVGTAPRLPGFEAATESFELVGRVDEGALLIWVQRFETNAPVLAATLQVEAGNRKLPAVFDAARGLYAVKDAALVQALQARPGPHALVLSLQAGDEADLIPASLTLPAEEAEGDHDHEHGSGTALRWRALIAGVALLVSVAAWWWFHRAFRTELKELDA